MGNAIQVKVGQVCRVGLGWGSRQSEQHTGKPGEGDIEDGVAEEMEVQSQVSNQLSPVAHFMTLH